MYYMRELGLHNPLVCGAFSDQDYSGVCQHGACCCSLCFILSNTPDRVLVYITSDFESSGVDKSKIL